MSIFLFSNGLFCTTSKYPELLLYHWNDFDIIDMYADTNYEQNVLLPTLWVPKAWGKWPLNTDLLSDLYLHCNKLYWGWPKIWLHRISGAKLKLRLIPKNYGTAPNYVLAKNIKKRKCLLTVHKLASIVSNIGYLFAVVSVFQAVLSTITERNRNPFIQKYSISHNTQGEWYEHNQQ